MLRRVAAASAAAAAVLALGACGGGGEPEVTTTIAGIDARFHGELQALGEDSATIVIGDGYFEPTVIVGEPGQVTIMMVRNEGSEMHTFTVPQQHVDLVLEPGEEGAAQLAFPTEGTLSFYCRFHRSEGMLGELQLAD